MALALGKVQAHWRLADGVLMLVPLQGRLAEVVRGALSIFQTRCRMTYLLVIWQQTLW